MKTRKSLFLLLIIASVLGVHNEVHSAPCVKREQKYYILDAKKPLKGQIKHKYAIYEIRDDFNLSDPKNRTNGVVEIPKGCELRFVGGCFRRGTLKGNNTRISAAEIKPIFSDIDIQGTFLIKDIYVDYMEIPDTKECGTEVRSILRLQNPEIQQNIYFPNRNLAFTPTSGEGCLLIDLTSNTKLYLNADITVNTNDVINYQVVRVYNQENVSVFGRGNKLKGDIESHRYSEKTTYGIGCYLYNVKNVSVTDLVCERFTCDGFYLGGDDILYANEDVELNHCISLYNRRQGLSVISGKNILIKDCEFSLTGNIGYESPGCGIDFEPNTNNQGLKNIVLKGCSFHNNYSSAIKFYLRNVDLYEDVSIDSCFLYNDSVQAEVRSGICVNNAIKNFTISNSMIPFFEYSFEGVRNYGEVVFSNTDILGIYHWNKDKTANYTAIFKGCTFGGDKYKNIKENNKHGFFYTGQHINLIFDKCEFDFRKVRRTKEYSFGYQGNPDVIMKFSNCIFFDDVSSIYGNYFENNVFHSYAANLSGSHIYRSVFKDNVLNKGSKMNGKEGAYIGLYSYTAQIAESTDAEITNNHIGGKISTEVGYDYPVVIYKGTSVKLKKVTVLNNEWKNRKMNKDFQSYLKGQIKELK